MGHARACLLAVVAVSLGFAPVQLFAQSSSTRGRVIVITVDETDIHDWVRGSSNFRAFLGEAAVGLLAVRTPADRRDGASWRASAYRTLGAGAAAGTEESSSAGGDPGGGTLGALGEALSRSGIAATWLGETSGPGSLAVMRSDGKVFVGPGRLSAASPTLPGDHIGRIHEALSWARVVLVDSGEASASLVAADRLLGNLTGTLTREDLLIVASLVPSQRRLVGGAFLAAVAVRGPGFSPGLLTSGTTRTDGVLSLTDLAPTILRYLGLDVPAEMEGRPANLVAARNPLDLVLARDRDSVLALASRRPFTRGMLVLAVMVLLLGTAAVLAGVRRGWVSMIAPLLTAVAFSPAALLLAPILPADSVSAVGLWALALAAVAGLAGAVLGLERSLGFVLALEAALFLGDLILGSPLTSRSALGFQIAGGGRFYGIDEGVLGVFLAAPLLALGVGLDRVRAMRSLLPVGALGLMVIVFLAGSPSFGSKFGAAFTLIPAIGVFLLLASGRKVTVTAMLVIALVTLAGAAMFVAIDLLGPADVRSHVGRAVSGGGSRWAIVARKAGSFARVTFGTAWLPATVALAGAVVLILRRQSRLVERAFFKRPFQRAALVAVAVGSAAALPSNDTGVITVAFAATLFVPVFLAPLLVEEPDWSLKPPGSPAPHSDDGRSAPAPRG